MSFISTAGSEKKAFVPTHVFFYSHKTLVVVEEAWRQFCKILTCKAISYHFDNTSTKN